MAQGIESTAGKRGKRGSYSSSVARNVRKKPILKRPRGIGRITKPGREIKASVPYEPDLLHDLLDPKYAKAYLSACMKDDHPGTFFVALRQVIQAQNGIADISKKLHLNRQGLYRALSEKGNPSMKTIFSILELLHFHFEIALS